MRYTELLKKTFSQTLKYKQCILEDKNNIV